MSAAAETNDQQLGPPPFLSWANAWSWAKIIVVILFVKGCVIDQYTVPSGSMEPTIHGNPGYFTGDRILVNKWTLGIRVPFTTHWLYRWHTPKRWDIVVFKPLPYMSSYPVLVKRLVGLPGDKILIKGGKLEINGKIEPFPDFMPEGERYFNREDLDMIIRHPQSSEWQRQNAMGLLTAGPEHEGPLYACVDKPQYTVVPEGHYLVLGDNSFESLDARFWGWLPEDRILGPVFAIWWPFTHRRDFSGFSHTWWGTCLIYGIPISIVALELRIQILEYRRRRGLAAKSAPATKGT